MGEELLVRISKISSNNSTPLIYLPKKVVKLLGLRKGVEVKLMIDVESKKLIIEKLEASK